MKAIKKMLKKVDVFGVPFSFRYKNEERYSTSLGGFFFIIFLLIVPVVGIYYLIPFINRKNYNLVYYSMNLPTAERIQLKESKAVFAIGFDCYTDEDTGINAEDILNLDFKYITYIKDKTGKRTKIVENLSTHICNYEDFYNQYNDELDSINLKTLRCLDKIDHKIEGIFADEVFSYYEFSVSSKIDSEENFNSINNYLTRNDCKFVIYYIDNTIYFDEYKNPIKPFLDSTFIQLNPALIMKMNVYFMNQYFYDDNLLLFNLDENKPIIKTSYSRQETYSLYKGLNRFVSKSYDYKIYSKIYIRADTNKSEIKRKYQKLIEFFADSSSILLGLFRLLVFILTFIDGIYAELSLSKRLFLFREVKTKHLDISKKNKQIKYLIDLTEPYKEKISTINRMNNEKSFRGYFKNLSLKKTETMKSFDEDDMKIFNKNKKLKISERKELSTEKTLRNEHHTKEKRKKNYKIKNEENNFQGTPMNSIKNNASNLVPLNLKSSIISNKEEFAINKPNKKIKYNFNIFEIILSNFCCCCLSKNLKLKRNLYIKANELLNKKFDIVLYTRNMTLIDIISKILLDENKKEIINILGRPVLFSEKIEEGEYDVFYKNYSKEDFNKMNDEILDLVKKPGKQNFDEKLISFTNEKLKELI